MGKHKSSAQESIMVRFMQRNRDLTKGFIKGNKLKSDMLWMKLVEKLNSNGPPIKDVVGWKKVWIDWKAIVRKKIAHHKAGWPANKLTSSEEKIGRICGFFQAVEKIEKTLEFAQPEHVEVKEEASSDRSESPSIDNTSILGTKRASTSNSRREPSFNEYECATNYIGEESRVMATIAEDILKIDQEHMLDIKDIIKAELKDLNYTFKKLNETQVCSAEEKKRHHIKMEKLREEELEIKRRKLELQEMQINMLSRKKK